MLLPKHKPITLTSHFISKYRKPEAMGLDPCLVTGETSKAGQIPPKHGTFIECNSDSDCLSMLRQAFLRIFAEQVLISEWKIQKSEKVEAAASAYRKLSSAESATERKSLWKMPQRVPPVLSPLDDIKLFIFLYLIDVRPSEEWRYILCMLWSSKRQLRLNRMEGQIQLCNLFGVYSLHFKTLSIQHVDTCMLLFFIKHFAEGKIIKYRYEILVCLDAVTLFNRNERQCEGVIVGAEPTLISMKLSSSRTSRAFMEMLTTCQFLLQSFAACDLQRPTFPKM